MAVFLVVLVMTMVTGIGMFSMHSASLVDRATGFHRQNVQSAAMVEFGARAAATWLGPNKAQVDANKEGVDGNGPVRTPGCNEALQAASTEAECWVIHSARINTQLGTSAPVPLNDGLLGQLSPAFDSTVIRAEIGTEVTEAFAANGIRAGHSGNNIKEITFTTHARIFPTDAITTTSCQAASRGAVSQQKLRAHALVF